MAWHELAHTFTLGLSNSRAPRWLSEGLSVLEERRARPSWGAGPTVEFIAAYGAGRLRPVSQLNEGFVRPRFPSEVILSYYDASLVCEMIASQKGPSALVNMLMAYRDGLDTRAVVTLVLGVTPDQLDKQFDTWLRGRFVAAFRSIQPGSGKGAPSGEFVTTMQDAIAQAEQHHPDSAQAQFLRAQALFPEYTGPDAPALYLAQIARDRGHLRTALLQVQRVTARGETAWEANLLEADLRERLGDSVGTRAPLERLIWILPYDVPLHVRLAELAARTGDHVLEIRERRAVTLLEPPDPLDARYLLARALANGGDPAGARRELLGVLEQAPAFEKAQALLLELRSQTPPRASPPGPTEVDRHALHQ
ncbi:hypothetical protein BH11GEM1_BH11GEM1_25020 [soil metagenome]